MEITRVGSQRSNKGPEDGFTGSVGMYTLFQPREHRGVALTKLLNRSEI